ncbi:PfkB family carbohydrate kinase [Parafrigoribacterium mesophilum]
MYQRITSIRSYLERMTEVVIFAPSPVLTVTVEDHPDGADVHLHAGGQGVWQARMLLRMGVKVAMCCVLSGESGRVLRHLLADAGIRVIAVERSARGGVYVHDRRGGERVRIVETGGEPIARHDLDELYGQTLREGLDASLVLLSGPAGKDTLPADIYRRLASDFRHGGRRVIVDLAGDRLNAALAGGVTVVKVSDHELLEDGRIQADHTDQLIAAMHRLNEEGAKVVIVTRAGRPLLVLAEHELIEVTPPTFEVADTSGAGDSLTAGVAASLATGGSLIDAVTLGAAAGALNVTRHGRGTGDAEAITRLRKLVRVRTVGSEAESAAKLSPAELATHVTEKNRGKDATPPASTAPAGTETLSAEPPTAETQTATAQTPRAQTSSAEK